MEIVVASNNRGKISEFRQLLSPLGITVLSLSEAGCALDAEETGTSFEENARIKASAVYAASGRPTLADDSGLEVNALDGAPGVYSARWAGENATDADRNAKLLRALEGVPAERRTARFVCVVHYIDENGRGYSFRGECEGAIGFAPEGENGFGYDPLFLVEGRSMALLSDGEKNRISHRGRAIRQLLYVLRENKED